MQPAALLLDYLALRSAALPRGCDAIIGFGHFDLRVARRCGELWRAGVSPRIIFSGGVGAGSADLTEPEADAFATELRRHYPEIPADAILIESRSTNTGENVQFLQRAATDAGWSLRSVCLVATPYRQRRVALTWRQQGPRDGVASNAPPATTLAEEIELYAAKGEDFCAHLPGEIDRLIAYAERGWIAPETVPDTILSAAKQLRDGVG